jgi:ATP-dependent DNA helicase RecG
VGPARGEALKALGIKTVLDLLHYFPRRHLDRTTITPLSKLATDQTATIIGRVEVCGLRHLKRRKMFQAVVSDGSGLLTLTWFNGISYIQNSLKTGDLLAVNGKVSFYKGYQMVHPEFEHLKEDENPLHSGAIIPLYPIPQALKDVGLDSRGIRRILREVLKNISPIEDHYPAEIRRNQKLVDLDQALRNIHYSEKERDLNQAIYRLKFDEHFFLQLLMALRKKSLEQTGATPLPKLGPQVQIIIEQLEFQLTTAQKRVLKEIRADMAKSVAMNRLLQGDVGSGKTIVAILAAVIAVGNHTQVALMAPTEILAHQHFTTFRNYLNTVHYSCALLVGGMPVAERKKILQGLKSGKINVVIGTHALIQEDVIFKQLGLVIVDEQHRFGVVQRSELTAKGFNPHLLAMTATPIPRTLAITYHGDMDISILDELPGNRQPVVTKVVDPERLPKVYQFIHREVESGRQCMVIYPLVAETEKSDLAAAEEAYRQLARTVFSDLRVGLIHGRMKKAEKDAIMNEFHQNRIQILVSTTVIEVGIDVPNATVMLVEHAERFGLTQLHQLRGRVGRGSEKSYCILVRRSVTEPSSRRLSVMEETNDGFKIADEDLKLRGPGEFFGIRQSGFLRYKIADLVSDGPIIRKARTSAFDLVEKDPDLSRPDQALIKKRFLKEYRDLYESLTLA